MNIIKVEKYEGRLVFVFKRKESKLRFDALTAYLLDLQGADDSAEAVDRGTKIKILRNGQHYDDGFAQCANKPKGRFTGFKHNWVGRDELPTGSFFDPNRFLEGDEIVLDGAPETFRGSLLCEWLRCGGILPPVLQFGAHTLA